MKAQRGIGALVAILVLVVLATLAAAIVRLGVMSQSASAQVAQGTRAAQAARAGLEWGLYQAFKGSWTACAGASNTLDLTSDTGMRVTVSCNSSTFNEGQATAGVALSRRLYTIDAVACNSTASCPDNGAATGPAYVERRRQVQAID